MLRIYGYAAGMIGSCEVSKRAPATRARAVREGGNGRFDIIILVDGMLGGLLFYTAIVDARTTESRSPWRRVIEIIGEDVHTTLATISTTRIREPARAGQQVLSKLARFSAARVRTDGVALGDAGVRARSEISAYSARTA